MNAIKKIDNHVLARQQMVQNQLYNSEVTNNSLLAAFNAVPREMFVTESVSDSAYVDSPLPTGNGRFLLAPVDYAHMLMTANINKKESVLNIACGTGYSAAILAHISHKVVSIDVFESSINSAKKNLHALTVDADSNSRTYNELLCVKNLSSGYIDKGSYDVIIINGITENIPRVLFDQLNGQLGRLVTIEKMDVMQSRELQTGNIVIYKRIKDNIHRHVAGQVTAPLIKDFSSSSIFVF